MKEDYYKESLKIIKNIKEKDKEPELLLHVCCGACSCFPLSFLAKIFKITILFSNSNIYPYEEFNTRLNALKKYVAIVEEKLDTKINIIVDDYDYNNFVQDLIPLKDEKEGGARCHLCIKKRFVRLFEYAKNNNFKYVATVMSISRNKDAIYLNKLGKEFEKMYPEIKYIISDFKRNGGQEIGIELSKKYGVYRQEYCGCEFSLNLKH